MQNKDCKYFHRHYGFNSEKNRLHKVNCGHCLIGKKRCENCQLFELSEDEKEMQIFDVMVSINQAEKSLNYIKEKMKKLQK